MQTFLSLVMNKRQRNCNSFSFVVLFSVCFYKLHHPSSSAAALINAGSHTRCMLGTESKPKGHYVQTELELVTGHAAGLGLLGLETYPSLRASLTPLLSPPPSDSFTPFLPGDLASQRYQQQQTSP